MGLHIWCSGELTIDKPLDERINWDLLAADDPDDHYESWELSDDRCAISYPTEMLYDDIEHLQRKIDALEVLGYRVDGNLVFKGRGGHEGQIFVVDNKIKILVGLDTALGEILMNGLSGRGG